MSHGCPDCGDRLCPGHGTGGCAPDAPDINKGPRCIAHGCTNHKHEGTFIGNFCAPCHNAITSGIMSPYGTSFLYTLKMERDAAQEQIMRLARCMSLEAPTPEEAMAAISAAIQQHTPWNGRTACDGELDRTLLMALVHDEQHYKVPPTTFSVNDHMRNYNNARDARDGWLTPPTVEQQADLQAGRTSFFVRFQAMYDEKTGPPKCVVDDKRDARDALQELNTADAKKLAEQQRDARLLAMFPGFELEKFTLRGKGSSTDKKEKKMPTARCIICTDPCGSSVCGPCSCLRSSSDRDLDEDERYAIRDVARNVFQTAARGGRTTLNFNDPVRTRDLLWLARAVALKAMQSSTVSLQSDHARELLRKYDPSWLAWIDDDSTDLRHITCDDEIPEPPKKRIHLIRLNDGVECAFEGSLKDALVLMNKLRDEYTKKNHITEHAMLHWRVQSTDVVTSEVER